jgi:hypothetical protein
MVVESGTTPIAPSRKCPWLAISSGPLDDIANCHRA